LPQYDFGTIDPSTKSGSGLATDLNSWRDALHSTHKDSAAPSYKVAGTPWIDDSASPWATKIYDGTDWITTGYIDPTNNIWTPAKAVTGYRVVGCNCANNSTTPNTQFDLDADLIVLADSNGYTHAIYDPGAAITNNISTAGPIANGRDQAGAFSNSSWVHFYWIWNGTTLATISSDTAPPTGPTLPSGYTHWAYAGANWIDGSGIMRKIHIRGSKVFYEATENALTSGSATTETSVSLASFVPPNALSALLNILMSMDTNAGGTAETQSYIRFVPNFNYFTAIIRCNAGDGDRTGGLIEIPNVSQTIYYLFANETNPGNIFSRGMTIQAVGYVIPNGGE
jgi:hypothetical protein